MTGLFEPESNGHIQLSAMGIPDLMLTGRTSCPHGSVS